MKGDLAKSVFTIYAQQRKLTSHSLVNIIFRKTVCQSVNMNRVHVHSDETIPCMHLTISLDVTNNMLIRRT